jgi:phosphoglycolate phosphatase
MKHFFEVTLFREDLRKSKPHPDPILQAIEMMDNNVGPEDVIWYIGDRHKDVRAALAARTHLPCTVQPLAYGLNASIAILEHNVGPDHIIMNYEDFYPKLEALLRKKPPPPRKRRAENHNSLAA